MAVNVSPLNLSNQRFSEQLKKLFTEEHCDPQYFELELTETSLSSHLEETIRILQELKEAKISIVLDDFGSGYSSLVYFTDFPIDKIKIDKSFVQGIPNKERNSIIIENIARLSKQLGIETLCEGVETEEQAVFLKKYGYEFAQGYFFSKPLSKERFEQKYLATV
jgi:EAL domain-containing protein (putative c-di-GMP-specific phosphodiesterase class I)